MPNINAEMYVHLHVKYLLLRLKSKLKCVIKELNMQYPTQTKKEEKQNGKTNTLDSITLLL
jgi:hypothetical protein